MGALDQDLHDTCHRFSVSALYVFGSRAEEIAGWVRGRSPSEPRSESDVDVGVIPQAGHCLSAKEKVRLAAALEDLFDVGRVDLLVVTEASAFLAVDIVAGELLVDEDPTATAELELYVLRRAADLLPFERARRELVLRGGGR